jgi:hypothetical protein
VIPADESSRRKLFAFAKALDIETIVTSAAPEALPDLDKLAGEFGVNVAFEASDPKDLVSSLDGLSSRIGLSVDTVAWAQAGIKPTDGLRLVNDRLLSLGLPDDGAGMGQLLLELAKLNPALPPPPVTCGDCAGPRVPVRPLFVTIGASGSTRGRISSRPNIQEDTDQRWATRISGGLYRALCIARSTSELRKQET